MILNPDSATRFSWEKIEIAVAGCSTAGGVVGAVAVVGVIVVIVIVIVVVVGRRISS